MRTPHDIFLHHVSRIQEVTYADIICEHVGGTAIVGAIPGKGDIDIQLRVPAENFDTVTKSLSTLYEIKRPEMWDAAISIFKTTEDDIPLDIIVTRIGGNYDYFHRIRDAISADPELLAAYNEIKRQHNPGSIVYLSPEYIAYSNAKKELYKKIFAEKFDKVFS